MFKIKIDKKQVLRYLGYRNQILDDSTNYLIDSSIEELKSLVEEKYVYKIFDLEKKDDILLKNTYLKLKGSSIKKHLKDANECILLALTLGHKVDSAIRYYEKVNMTKAVILDACASTAIEELADNICEKLEKEFLIESKGITNRFSPGYGDLDIDMQSDFLDILNARKSIGLTATSNSILIPRKSVTAILGVVDIEYKKEKTSCENCSKYDNCNYRK